MQIKSFWGFLKVGNLIAASLKMEPSSRKTRNRAQEHKNDDGNVEKYDKIILIESRIDGIPKTSDLESEGYCFRGLC